MDSKTKRRRFANGTRLAEDNALDALERAAFRLMRDSLVYYLSLKLVHPSDDRQVFAKIDAPKERGFGATLFHFDGVFNPTRPMQTLDKSKIR